MTYEGSLTRPGCEEGVTWILMNRPIYAGPIEMAQLRSLRQGEKLHPKSPVGAPNARPVQEMNGRTVRTNLVVAPSSTSSTEEESRQGQGETRSPTERNKKGSRRRKQCPEVAKDMVYRSNSGWDQN